MIVSCGNPFGANLRLFGLVFDNKRQLFINGDINKNIDQNHRVIALFPTE